jgi:hypothetical protein
MRPRFPVVGYAICVLSLSRIADAQASDGRAWELTGSYFNLFTRSRTLVPPDEDFTLDLNRLRLKLEARPVKPVGLDLQYDHELWLGSYLHTAQYALTEDRARTRLDLQREYARKPDLVARHGLYRVALTWSGANTDVKVGRQRIALGSGYFWSPLDLVNPIDPTRLERDYRDGADAVLVEQRLGPVGRASAMYVPSMRHLKGTTAGYLHGNMRGADYSLLVGTFRGDRAAGAGLSTSIGGLGVRSELMATRAASDGSHVSALLGVDYGFANSLTVSAEAYYNGRGASRTARYDVPALLAGRVLNLARWYAGMAATYQVTPRAKAAGYVVLNASDGSAVVWPRVEWSAKPSLDIALGLQCFSGGARTEYGRASNLVHLETRWFF